MESKKKQEILDLLKKWKEAILKLYPMIEGEKVNDKQLKFSFMDDKEDT